MKRQQSIDCLERVSALHLYALHCTAYEYENDTRINGDSRQIYILLYSSSCCDHYHCYDFVPKLNVCGVCRHFIDTHTHHLGCALQLVEHWLPFRLGYCRTSAHRIRCIVSHSSPEDDNARWNVRAECPQWSYGCFLVPRSKVSYKYWQHSYGLPTVDLELRWGVIDTWMSYY